MRPVRPRQEVEALKQRILDTALQLITQEGFGGVTMRSLGRELGMTAPNLYNYYGSKDEIYMTLMLQGFIRLKASLVEGVSPDAPVRVQARDFMLSYLRFGLEHPEHYQLMFSSHAPKAPAYKGTEIEGLSQLEFDTSMEIVSHAEGFAKNVLEALGISSNKAQRRALIIELWSLLHGMISLRHSSNSQYLTDNPVQTYEDIVGSVLDRILQGQQETALP